VTVVSDEVDDSVIFADSPGASQSVACWSDPSAGSYGRFVPTGSSRGFGMLATRTFCACSSSTQSFATGVAYVEDGHRLEALRAWCHEQQPDVVGGRSVPEVGDSPGGVGQAAVHGVGVDHLGVDHLGVDHLGLIISGLIISGSGHLGIDHFRVIISGRSFRVDHFGIDHLRVGISSVCTRREDVVFTISRLIISG
jgi:hypothetical protein